MAHTNKRQNNGSVTQSHNKSSAVLDVFCLPAAGPDESSLWYVEKGSFEPIRDGCVAKGGVER